MSDKTGLDECVNAGWPDFEKGYDAAGRHYVNFEYADVNHGFHNDTTPLFDKAAAELAWQRTVEFFTTHLQP